MSKNTMFISANIWSVHGVERAAAGAAAVALTTMLIIMAILVFRHAVHRLTIYVSKQFDTGVLTIL